MGNVGRVWAEGRKGPALTLGCKSESHHVWLSSNAQDTWTQGVQPSPAEWLPAWSIWDGPHCPGALLCFPTHRHVLPAESSSSRVTTSSCLVLLPGSLPKRELLQPQLAADSAPSAPRQDRSREALAQTPRELRPSRAPVTKQQHGPILGFLRIL